MLKDVNATIIILVPKMEVPMTVGDFRPISCCNVLYECISKILANRIMGCLGDIVDDTQSAFVPGRKINDNVQVV
ncbi:hypothetical protein Patl1_31272 [Pistacia atlantica]|uniref:Uncharacterized protein n=1 Tax=Pistacia atlantica TaxID=434234 RepID=A0ACC1ADK9_9ROSI|nr:hypothetical protein Patl1_31272 [Pistacia atlantica]